MERVGLQSQGQDNDHNGKEALESDWESPDEVLWAVDGAEVDPISYHCANCDGTAFDTDDLATVMGLAASGSRGRLA